MMFEATFNRLGGIHPATGSEFVPLTHADAAAIEKAIGAPLPASYREFVSRFGCSAFGASIDFVPIIPFTSPPSGHGHFGFFFGGKGSTHLSYSVSWNRSTYAGRVADALLPIAGDGGGDLICLGVHGEHHGKIDYWDHTAEPRNEEDYWEAFGEPRPEDAIWSNVSLIAWSFSDFLDRLYVVDG